MKILITGHTGFKGSWLVLYLTLLGHKVSGIAKNPPVKSLFKSAGVENHLISDQRLDIRDNTKLLTAIIEIKPDAVIHLAAQSLVLESFKNTRETYETNFMGTFNVLDASMKVDSINNILVITSDKVYTNTNLAQEFVETDSLGGGDPYSNSKAVSDILAQNWIKNRPNFNIGILRAGNVIGGGDFANNRLLPDIIEAHKTHSKIIIRNPKATRPWQHVFDCLSGYEKALNYVSKGNSGAWNIGPDMQNNITVQTFIAKCSAVLGNEIKVDQSNEQYNEKNFLALSTNKAKLELNWQPKYDLDKSIEITLQWYLRNIKNPESIPEFSISQLEDFLNK